MKTFYQRITNVLPLKKNPGEMQLREQETLLDKYKHISKSQRELLRIMLDRLNISLTFFADSVILLMGLD